MWNPVGIRLGLGFETRPMPNRLITAGRDPRERGSGPLNSDR